MQSPIKSPTQLFTNVERGILNIIDNKQNKTKQEFVEFKLSGTTKELLKVLPSLISFLQYNRTIVIITM